MLRLEIIDRGILEVSHPSRPRISLQTPRNTTEKGLEGTISQRKESWQVADALGHRSSPDNASPIAYYVSFGPHGPREPIVPPGSNVKIFFGTLAAMGAAVGVFALIRSQGRFWIIPCLDQKG